MKNNNKNQSILRSSEVVKTFNEPCFNLLSLDHNGQFNFNAKAKYSMSFWSGQISEASFMKSLNSEKGANSRFKEIKDSNKLISSNESPDLSEISFLYLSTSFNKYSGVYSFNFSEKSISDVLPDGETKAETIMFASTTNSINNYLVFSSLNLLCKDAFIFFPISKASFSVNFNLDTIDLNKISCETLFFIASL